MTFGQTYAACWRGGTAFIVACPLLALVPIVPELVQHVVEVHRGMYDSLAAAKAADADPVRMAFGWIKILGLVLPGYWIARFLQWGDARAARRYDPAAARLFAGVVAFEMTLAAVQLFALPRTGAWLLGEAILGQIVGTLLVAWRTAAPLGNRAIGIAASVRIMARRLPSSLALMILAVLPLMVPHYALGAAALLAPAAWRWPVLIVDTLVVGWLSAVMTAAGVLVAERACAASGVALVSPAPAPAPASPRAVR